MSPIGTEDLLDLPSASVKVSGYQVKLSAWGSAVVDVGIPRKPGLGASKEQYELQKNVGLNMPGQEVCSGTASGGQGVVPISRI